MKRRLKKALKLGLLLATGLITASLIIVFSIGPALLAKRFNPVGNQALEVIASETEILHQSLTIV
ncbi:MAG: peptidase M19, partial [Cyanobacteria bacterium P01_H01_bin.119]